MRKSTYDVVDFYEIIWLMLAEFYPFKHFGKDGAAAHIKAYIRERYKFHWAKNEPSGPNNRRCTYGRGCHAGLRPPNRRDRNGRGWVQG